jgi:hypothetical protein
MGWVAHTCNPSTQEAEAGGQPGLPSETLFQEKNKGRNTVYQNNNELHVTMSL